MKGFLKRIILFLILPVVFFIVCFAVLNYCNNRSFNNFRINPAVHTLFIGDSHIQLGIDDKLIPGSINLSQLSEPYKFTFFKLLTLLKNNPSIRKVYVGFSYNNVSSYYDDVIDGKNSKDVSGMYFFIFPPEEKKSYLKLYHADVFDYLRIVMLNGLKNLVVAKQRMTFLGRYENNFKISAASKISMDKRLLFQYYKDSNLRDFSSKNIYYLDKIIELCKKSGIELILLSTPLHPYYKKNIPLKFIEKYNSYLNERNIKPLRLDDFILDDSCFVPDGDHISVKGTVFVADQLNK